MFQVLASSYPSSVVISDEVATNSFKRGGTSSDRRFAFVASVPRGIRVLARPSSSRLRKLC